MIYDPVDIRIQSQTNVRSEESGGVVLWKGGWGVPATPTLTLNPPLKLKITSGLAAV